MPTNDDIRAFRNYDSWKQDPPEYPEPEERLVCHNCGDEIDDSQYEKTKGKISALEEKEYLDKDENILYLYGLCFDCHLEILENRTIENFRKLMES